MKQKYGGMGLISEKMNTLYVELNERMEAATSCYSATGDFLQYIYFVVVAKNYQKIRPRWLVHEFSQIFFNDSSHGCRAALLNKKSLWLLPFYMAWVFIAIMKRCAERCNCNCIIPP